MPTLLIEPEPEAALDHHAFNLARWAEMLADPALNAIENRVESDRYGDAVVMPMHAPEHGATMCEVAFALREALPDGRGTFACPISTTEGVKAVDVAWSTLERRRAQTGQPCLTLAPEICVEVFSPANSRRQLHERKRLYFESGAEEVWFCLCDGRMEFYRRDAPDVAATSQLCPHFPPRIDVSL